MITVTTALRKICGLSKKIWGIQGGQGAGKTFSIMIIIIDFALKCRNKEIYVISAQLSKMRITVIKDAMKILSLLGVSYEATGIESGSPIIRFASGSFIRFIGLDKEDIGKGLRSDLVFVNEGNKCKFNAIREALSRAKRSIIDFNPNAKFWFHKEIQNRPDCDFLKLTYLDNEQLSQEEVNEVLMYKAKGFDPAGSYDHTGKFDPYGKVISPYWANMWRIYGLGEIGQAEGRIYQWKKCTYAEFLAIPAQSYYGCDWGHVDPFAIVEVKYYDGVLYAHELNYASENEIRRGLPETILHQIKASDEEGLVPYVFNLKNVRKDCVIVCDSNRKKKIVALRTAGWEYAVGIGKKSELTERVGTLQAVNVHYTDISENIEYEEETYCYAKDRNDNLLETPEDMNNHTIDAIAYVADWLIMKGVIKVAA